MASLLTSSPVPYLSAGVLVLDTHTRSLTGPTGSCRLDVAPFIVLRELMRRPGAVISQEQLIEASWPDQDSEPDHPEDAIRARVCRAREALERVGAPREQLALRFPRGYSIEGERRVVRAYTPRQAAALDRLVATHPDRAAVLELSAC